MPGLHLSRVVAVEAPDFFESEWAEYEREARTPGWDDKGPFRCHNCGRFARVVDYVPYADPHKFGGTITWQCRKCGRLTDDW